MYRQLLTQARRVMGAESTLKLRAEVATTSGTSHDFTDIPSNARRVTIMFDGVSTNGTTGIGVRLSDSGGFETTGYHGGCGGIATASAAATSANSMFVVTYGTITATSVHSGSVTLTLEDATNNTWCLSGCLSGTVNHFSHPSGGRLSLDSVLTGIQVRSQNGSDTFDAGAVSIMIET